MTQIDVEIKHADGRIQLHQLSDGSYLVGREVGDIVLGDPDVSARRSPQLEAERRYPERFAAAQKKYTAGMFRCSDDKAFRNALTDQASSSTARASFEQNRTRRGAGLLTSEPSADSLLLGAAGVLGGVTLMLVAMGLLAGAFWL